MLNIKDQVVHYYNKSKDAVMKFFDKIIYSPWLTLLFIVILVLIGLTLQPILQWYVGIPVVALLVYVLVRHVKEHDDDWQ